MEQFSKSTPIIIPTKTTTTYKVIFISFHWEQASIIIHLRGENGEIEIFTYGGPNPVATQGERDIALQMMIGLNKANLTTKSLHRRILERLVTDGHIAGSITGVPD